MEGDLAATRLEAARAEARLEEAHEELRALREREERLVMERCVGSLGRVGWWGCEMGVFMDTGPDNALRL